MRTPQNHKLILALALMLLLCTACNAAQTDRDEIIFKSMSMRHIEKALDSWQQETQKLPWRIASTELVSNVVQEAQKTARAKLDVHYPIRAVDYTVVRGGTLKDVANNFGIHHHDILALNPGLALDTRLNEGQSVMVYQYTRDSHSIGYPWNGKLENGVPVPEGAGRILRGNRNKCWGNRRSVTELDYILRQWAKRYPQRDPIFVGNLSQRTGGPQTPHKTHQSGTDVDLSYPIRRGPKDPLNWFKATLSNIDCQATWDLLLLCNESGVEVFFVDYHLQEALHTCKAPDGQTYPIEWLQFPQGKQTSNRKIRHSDGHEDHMHVVFKCDPLDTQCKTAR